MPTNAPLNRKLRMGLVGGGQGAFIGRVHATAAVLDNRAALVAGALSSDPAKAKASAPDYDIPADRAYGSYKEMAAAEEKRPRHGRFRLRRHAQPHALRDRQGLRRGRLQRHLRQADDVRSRPGRGTAEGRREDRRRLRRHAQLHRLSARAAGPRDGPRPANSARSTPSARSTSRAGCARGSEASDQKQAAWRTDPKQSGAAGCFGDIGTHAYNLGRYITGLLPEGDLLPS